MSETVAMTAAKLAEIFGAYEPITLMSHRQVTLETGGLFIRITDNMFVEFDSTTNERYMYFDVWFRGGHELEEPFDDSWERLTWDADDGWRFSIYSPETGCDMTPTKFAAWIVVLRETFQGEE